jgi:hypothetical protein
MNPRNGSMSSPPSPPNGRIGGIGSIGGHLATLANLQARLAAIDTKETVQKAAPWIGTLIACSILAVAGLTVALLGASSAIAAASGLSEGTSLLITGAISLLVSTSGALIAARRFAGCFTSFRRSGEELERNVAWIRTVMEHSGR